MKTTAILRYYWRKKDDNSLAVNEKIIYKILKIVNLAIKVNLIFYVIKPFKIRSIDFLISLRKLQYFHKYICISLDAIKHLFRFLKVDKMWLIKKHMIKIFK